MRTNQIKAKNIKRTIMEEHYIIYCNSTMRTNQIKAKNIKRTIMEEHYIIYCNSTIYNAYISLYKKKTKNIKRTVMEEHDIMVYSFVFQQDGTEKLLPSQDLTECARLCVLLQLCEKRLLQSTMKFARDQKTNVTEVFRRREEDAKLGLPVQESEPAAAGKATEPTLNGIGDADGKSVGDSEDVCKDDEARCTTNEADGLLTSLENELERDVHPEKTLKVQSDVHSCSANCSTGEDHMVTSLEKEREVDSGETVANACKEDTVKCTKDVAATSESECDAGAQKGVLLTSEDKLGSGEGATETETAPDSRVKGVVNEKNSHNCCAENKAIANNEC